MSKYMDYNEWLEQEIKIYKRENKLLNEKLDNFNTIFNEVDNKKNDILKWGYSLEKENEKLKEKIDNLRQDLQNRCDRCIELNNKNEQLKQQIEELTSENFELQNDLFTEQLNEDETNDYIDNLKKELFNSYLLNEHQERLISELKTALSDYNNFVDVMFPD